MQFGLVQRAKRKKETLTNRLSENSSVSVQFSFMNLSSRAIYLKYSPRSSLIFTNKTWIMGAVVVWTNRYNIQFYSRVCFLIHNSGIITQFQTTSNKMHTGPSDVSCKGKLPTSDTYMCNVQFFVALSAENKFVCVRPVLFRRHSQIAYYVLWLEYRRTCWP